MFGFEELRQLVAFEELGTLSRVAEQFHISTPSVTRSMKNLEDEFGVLLFNRSKNKIELNETGKLAVSYAKKLLNETEQMIIRVKEFDEKQRTLVIKSCAPAPLWELLKKIGTIHNTSGMTISSSICQNEEVIGFLKNDDCDIAILPFDIVLDGWQSIKLMEEHLFVCVPKSHELARHKKLTFSDLDGFNFLIRSELGFWDTICREKMPASKFLVQTDEDVFNELIRESSLPCFTTDYIVAGRNPYRHRIAIPIKDEAVNVQFYLMVKANINKNNFSK